MPVRAKSSTKIYRESDLDDSIWARFRTAKVAVVGFGNQGSAQAHNLRDSGFDVMIGNIADPYFESAKAQGFAVTSIGESVAKSDIVMILLPDELTPAIFRQCIQSKLRPGQTLVFASGYAVAFGEIVCPADCDVLLLAPRMIGRGVRELYQTGEGFFSFVAIEQNFTGNAKNTLLALARGIGTLKRGAVEVTFRMEAELDLFNEQGFGPAFGQVLLTAIRTMLDAGYPKEAVLLELYLSGEFGYICKDMAETGLIGQLDHHSATSQYGAMSRGIKFLRMGVAKPMQQVLAGIRSGRFVREWRWEKRLGGLRHRLLRFFAARQPVGRVEREVRQHLGFDS